jgi:hypothetical protein
MENSKLILAAQVWVPGKPRDHVTTLTVFVSSAEEIGKKFIDDAFEGVAMESTPIHSDKNEIDPKSATIQMELGSFVRLLLQGDMMAVQVSNNLSDWSVVCCAVPCRTGELLPKPQTFSKQLTKST